MNSHQFAHQWDQLAAQGLTDEQIRHTPRDRATTRPTPAIAMPVNEFQAAGQALQDAQMLICDVRDIDPTDLWHTIAAWNPTRIVTALITLAAMVPDDQPAEQLLSWLNNIREEIKWS